jgi:hypothetical protein
MHPSEKHPFRHAASPSPSLLPQLTRYVLLPAILLLGAFTSPCQARGGGGHGGGGDGGGHSSSGRHSSGRSSFGSRSSYRAPGEHYTRGYTRRDSTYVPGHYQTNPNGDFYDNYSTKGNVNPHTGKEGTLVTPSGNERGEIDYRGIGNEGDGRASNKQVYQDNKSSGEATAVPSAPVVAAAPSPPRLPQVSTFPQRVRIQMSDGNSYFGNVTAFDGSHYTVDTKNGSMTVDQANITTLEILSN